MDAVLANASASDAEAQRRVKVVSEICDPPEAPGLERLLEARKRLKEIEEEKAESDGETIFDLKFWNLEITVRFAEATDLKHFHLFHPALDD